MDSRAQKISATMRKRGLDNFHAWRDRAREEGKFGHPSVPLRHSGNLAEFIGVVLGDGNISAFPRTERLIIACDAAKPLFVARYANMASRLFAKSPTISKMKTHCIRISVYQKNIAKRLGIPSGNRSAFHYPVPRWIRSSNAMIIRFLRGLYEAEGSLSFHKATYTHKFLFSNRNEALLDNVYRGLQRLGFHPHRSWDKIQLSRKLEVQQCVKLLKFRKYDTI